MISEVTPVIVTNWPGRYSDLPVITIKGETVSSCISSITSELTEKVVSETTPS